MSQVFIVGFGKFGQLALPKISQALARSPDLDCGSGPGTFDRGENLRLSGCWIKERISSGIIKIIWHPKIGSSRPYPFTWPEIGSNGRSPETGRSGKLNPPGVWAGVCPSPCISRRTSMSAWLISSARRIVLLLRESVSKPGTRDPGGSGRFWRTQPLSRGTLEILESHQLAPGLGGFTFGELKRIGEILLRTDPPLFLATACPCHGVISGFTW